MVNEFTASIKRVENGYIVVSTQDGPTINDYSKVTKVYSDLIDALSFISRNFSEAHITFSNLDETGGL